jgi:phage baseplate assembly protein W
MPTNVRQFRDLSMIFNAHPVSHDVVTKVDASAVKQSIRNLVLTMNYEKPFHPEKGCQIYGLLFENVDMVSLQIAKQSIINVITQYEPRANLIEVVLEDLSTQNAVNISIYFTVLNSDAVEQVDVFVDRLR